MAREIPEVVRAAAGLAATVLDEARKLPETLPGLPVRVIGLAMQQAMKIQQQYAGFVARGDELFTGLRGEDEPGLATFDDDLDEAEAAAPSSNGYRESAFDRAEVPLAEVPLTEDSTDDDVVDVPAAPVAEKPARKKAAKAVKPPKAPKPGKGDKPARAPRKAPAADASAQVEEAQQSLDALPAEAPSTEEVLEELAIEELVADASVSAADAAPAGEDVTADVATTADVLTAEGDVATVEASVTDEGVAAPEGPADTATDEGGTTVAAATGVRTDEGETGTAEEDAAIATGATVDAVGEASAAPTDDPAGGSELSGSQAAGTAPIDGYDSFSIAQLRGRLRGYAASTVENLLAYEQAAKAREPYLRMLRNRLERLDAQAVDASPLAPRGT
jgi:hypothetical protein